MKRTLSLVLAALVALPAPALAQTQVRPGPNTIALLRGSATQPTRTFIDDPRTGSFLKTTGEEAFVSGGIERWSFNASRILSTIPIQVPQLLAPAGQNLDFGANGVGSLWRITTSGHQLALGPYNIGDGAGNSPVTIWSEGEIISGAAIRVGPGSVLYWQGRSRIDGGTTDGVITLWDSNQTSFSRLQFGGTTSAFPALKRDGANIHIRLADDSGYTALYASRLLTSAGEIQFNAAGSIRDLTGAGSPEGVVTASIGSTYRRTDGGAGTSFYVKESGIGNAGWVAK